MNASQDKRKVPRMPASYEVSMTHEGKTSIDVCQDISPLGVGLLTRQNPAIGSLVDLSIFLDNANINVQIKGIVRHSRISEKGSDNAPTFLLGIEFLEGHEKAHALLISEKEHSSHAVTQTVSIDADIDTCYRLLCETEKFPEWDSALESSNVLERYPDGRAKKVEYMRNFLMRKMGYTDIFTYDDQNYSMSWKSVKSDKDIVSNQGGYNFKKHGPEKTLMTFHIELTIGFLPSNRIVNYFSSISARKEMKNFKNYVEKHAG
jgi:uncharacterized membrane protein